MSDAVRGFTEDLYITPPDREIYRAVKAGWDAVAKPLDGMGKFEGMIAQIGAVQGAVHPEVEHGALLVLCGDNGIVREGVSQSGQGVTRACAVNLGRQQTAVCVMAKEAGIRVVPVDIGIARADEAEDAMPGGGNAPLTGPADRENLCSKNASLDEASKKPSVSLSEDRIPGVLNAKVAFGTKDFLLEPAMTESEVRAAVQTGILLVRRMKDEGYTILGIGELGIGNTTTSACVAAALLGGDPLLIVGRGAGLSEAGLERKRKVVQQGLAKWQLSPESDPLRVLQTVGGLDIAGMAGACIGGALYHVPIVLDGVISMTAALVAERLVPGVRAYLIPSHTSREPAARLIEKELSLSPVLDADMALGEGTGAVMMLSLLRLADQVYEHGVRFGTGGVAQYQRYADAKSSGADGV